MGGGPSVTDDSVGVAPDDPRGIERTATGAAIGLAAGVVGLALPVGLVLLQTYSPGTVFLTGVELVEATALFALVGALLFAGSLILFRIGFAALRKFDPRFWVASVLCMLGTVGVILLLIPIGLAAASSTSLVSCVRGAPSRALGCLSSVAPLAADWGMVAFWLLWLGGLGIVVGVGLAGVRYRQGWFYGGAALYALLLLGLLGPALGLLFPIGALAYPLLAAPFLVLAAPAMILRGSRRTLAPS